MYLFWVNHLCLWRFRLARSRGVFGESPFDSGFVSRVVWCPLYCTVRACHRLVPMYMYRNRIAFFWYYYQWAYFYSGRIICVLGDFALLAPGFFSGNPLSNPDSCHVWSGALCIVRCVLITVLYLCIWQIPNPYFHYTFMYGCLFVCFSFFFFFFRWLFLVQVCVFSPFKCECPGGVGVASRINTSRFWLGTVRVLLDSFFFFSFFSASLLFFLFYFIYETSFVCVCVFCVIFR